MENKDLSRHVGRFYGLYRGYVFDNKDPKNLGRLKVCCPSVYGIDDAGSPLVSDWAYPKFPVSGFGWGIQMIPPAKNPDGSNVLVWLEFEMGDINCPVWSGSPVSLNGLQTNVLENQKKKVAGTTMDCMLCITTPKGCKIIMDDEKGIITINTPKGNKFIMDDEKGNIVINNTTFSQAADNFNSILAAYDKRLKNGGL